MANRSADWFEQAERNLEQARASADENRHEWACFAAHQGAELGVKALHLARGQEAWGHVVVRLLQELPSVIPDELVEKARVLDTFYIPTRYPNGHAEGPPYQHYGRLQSREAIDYAGEILAFVRDRLADSK